ncbi:MutS-related protein [Bacillus horti]|uniref:DsDNA-specific endonuclease/ATPase MutS2 n=1 Tax=Caldalkalibacillus horti TaxID=77523 RepID=A0ABT9VVS7_9BACI|nr:hypothetical protein [Bacillus horti]MDQ0165098.1 dsDNA-specific endonuclease/ATPase MutS2 [Bacillus horti]
MRGNMEQEQTEFRTEVRRLWADSVTLATLQWESILEELKPLSIFGRNFKRRLTPFETGEEELWLEEIRLSKALEQMEHELRDEAFLAALRAIPNPLSFLALLEQDETGDQSDWFVLKQFLQQALVILQPFLKLQSDLQQTQRLLHACLAPLGAEDRGLSLDKISPRLADCQGKAARLEKEFQQHKTLRIQQLERELEHELDQVHRREQHIHEEQEHRKREKQGKLITQRDRYVYVSIYDQKALEICRARADLEQKQQTPFEIIFALIPDEQEKKLENSRKKLQKELERLEQESLRQLAQNIRPFLQELHQVTVELGKWDWRRAKWAWKKARNLEWPMLGESLVVREGRFLPLLDKLEGEGRAYSPLHVQAEYGCTLLTGMNMGGKSIALKTIGSLCLQAHFALPVSASFFQTALLQGLQMISGDQQSVTQELSTFGAEMHQLGQTLVTSNKLILLDELSRGTNPHEGEALVYAVMKQLAESKRHISVLVSHFTFKKDIPNIRCYQSGEMDGTGKISYTLREVQQGGAPRQAFYVAEQLGVPTEIIELAKQYLSKTLSITQGARKARKAGAGEMNRKTRTVRKAEKTAEDNLGNQKGEAYGAIKSGEGKDSLR